MPSPGPESRNGYALVSLAARRRGACVRVDDPDPKEVRAHGSGPGYRKETHGRQAAPGRTAPGAGNDSGFPRQRVTDIEQTGQLQCLERAPRVWGCWNRSPERAVLFRRQGSVMTAGACVWTDPEVG